MKIGMLWFDNDAKLDLKSKITRAADYYKDKYGRIPNSCHMHSTMIPEEYKDQNIISDIHPTILVFPDDSVLPNHLWIGMLE